MANPVCYNQYMLRIGSLKLSQPTVLAPMAALTDQIFRTLIDEIGGCGLMVSEMISAEGLRRRNRRTREMLGDFCAKTPQFVQLFGSDPQALAEAARIIEDETAFAGIDLNMGCPVPKVVRHGAGSALLQNLDQAAAVISAVRRSVDLPVTVKVRLGFHRVTIHETIRVVQEAGADALTVHFRLANDSYSCPARWEWAPKIRDEMRIPLLGNGDIFSTAGATEKRLEVDGVAIGRGALYNPFIFAEIAGCRTRPRQYPWVAARLCELIERLSPQRLWLPKLKSHLRYLSFAGALTRSQKKDIFLSQDYRAAKPLFLQRIERMVPAGEEK